MSSRLLFDPEDPYFSKEVISTINFTQVPVIFSKTMSPTHSLFLSILISFRNHLYEKGRIHKNDYFYFTASKAEEYNISKYQQKEAIQDFEEKGFISTTMKVGKCGSNQRFYRINDEYLFKYVQEQEDKAKVKNLNIAVKANSKNLDLASKAKVKNLNHHIVDIRDGSILEVFKFQKNLNTVPGNFGNFVSQGLYQGRDPDEVNKEIDKLAPKRTSSKNSNNPIVNIPLAIQPYIELWEEFGFRKHGRNTAILKDSVSVLKKMLAGVFFEDKPGYEEYEFYRLGLEDFKTSLTNFKKRFDMRYKPENKNTLPQDLKTFLYNPNAKVYKSHFIQNLKNEPRQIKTKREDKHSQLTEILVSEFGKQILGNDNYKPINEVDWNKFTMASERLAGFFDRHKDRYNGTSLNALRMSGLLISSIKKDVGNSMTISPGFLCSNKTFEERLPRYLKEQAIILPKKKKTIQQIEKEINGMY